MLWIRWRSLSVLLGERLRQREASAVPNGRLMPTAEGESIARKI
jgi:hypothetical protein